MTLDEAIIHAEYVAESNEDMANVYHTDEGVYLREESKCRKCAEEHRQLVEWLTELKERRAKDEPRDSEKPNNCEHITEDGVTCAKYPACDDCIDNPLNKVKGSERLVKGLEKTDCQTCKWWSSYEYCVHRECKGYEPQMERSSE